MSEYKLPHDHGYIDEKMLEHIPNEDDFQVVSDIFKLLCDKTRIKILWILFHCEDCVINIAALVEMSSPAVSHHLRQLKASGLIVSRREGKEVYYKAADTEQARLLHVMIEETLAIACPSKD